MNYRHAYHAGNFADVLKHVVLARVLTYMKLKPQPFRVIDTHAGAGRYDLDGIEAGKTNEWRDGIGRLLHADVSNDVAALLAPYLDAVRAINADDTVRFYPGSPLIARHLMRAGDVLMANELHPDDAARLIAEFRHTRDTKVLSGDAWGAVKALLPPPERRGVVLIDPPFERPDEFAMLEGALRNALSRFATGVYLVWYPIKDRLAADDFIRTVAGLSCRKVLDVRLATSEPFAGLGLTETGVVLLNPPFSLKSELQIVLPVLSDLLAEGRGADFALSEPAEPL